MTNTHTNILEVLTHVAPNINNSLNMNHVVIHFNIIKRMKKSGNEIRYSDYFSLHILFKFIFCIQWKDIGSVESCIVVCARGTITYRVMFAYIMLKRSNVYADVALIKMSSNVAWKSACLCHETRISLAPRTHESCAVLVPVGAYANQINGINVK